MKPVRINYLYNFPKGFPQSSSNNINGVAYFTSICLPFKK